MNRKRTKIYEQLSSLASELTGMKISDLSHSEGDIPRNIKTDLINFDYSKQRISKEALGFLGGDGGEALKYCNKAFIVPDKVTARIQESHITAGHALLQYVEDKLFEIAWLTADK